MKSSEVLKKGISLTVDFNRLISTGSESLVLVIWYYGTYIGIVLIGLLFYGL